MTAEPPLTNVELRRQFHDLYTRYQRTNKGGEQALDLLKKRGADMEALDAEFIEWNQAAGLSVKSIWQFHYETDGSQVTTGLILLGLGIVGKVVGHMPAFLQETAPGLIAAGIAVTILAAKINLSRSAQPEIMLSNPNVAEKIDEILSRREETEAGQPKGQT